MLEAVLSSSFNSTNQSEIQEELQQIRIVLKNLAQKVNRLERENAMLLHILNVCTQDSKLYEQWDIQEIQETMQEYKIRDTFKRPLIQKSTVKSKEMKFNLLRWFRENRKKNSLKIKDIIASTGVNYRTAKKAIVNIIKTIPELFAYKKVGIREKALVLLKPELLDLYIRKW